MTDKSPKKVLKDLGDGLIMRSAVREDADALAEFCAQVFMDEPLAQSSGEGTEAYWIANWIRDLLGKPHPTLNPDDIIIVEDVEKGCIASTTTYLTQTWSYDGVEFEIGRPEIVGTDREVSKPGLSPRTVRIDAPMGRGTRSSHPGRLGHCELLPTIWLRVRLARGRRALHAGCLVAALGEGRGAYVPVAGTRGGRRPVHYANIGGFDAAVDGIGGVS